MPRKNILEFLGRPMIVYTIEAALECGLFDKVVVSSEDEEILKVAVSAGAEISRRPQRLATDEVSVVDVCLDLLTHERNAGRLWEIMVCLYATAPLRGAKDIRAVVDEIVPGKCEFAMAVSRYHFPPYQALKRGENGFLNPMWPELISKRSQEVPSLVVDNGSTYAVLTEAFERERSFYGSTLHGVELPWERSIDIDTAEDLDLALYYAKKGKR